MNGSHANSCETNAVLDQMFKALKTDLYNMQEAEMNLMNDSQKFYNVAMQYLAGNIDYAALVRAQKGMEQTSKNWHKVLLQYVIDENNFGNAIETAVVSGLPDFYFVNQVNSLNALKASIPPTTPVAVVG